MSSGIGRNKSYASFKMWCTLVELLIVLNHGWLLCINVNTQIDAWVQWKTCRRLSPQISRTYIQAKSSYLTSNSIQGKLFLTSQMYISQPIYMITNKPKILALLGYIKMRQINWSSLENLQREHFPCSPGAELQIRSSWIKH